ncbi:UNVERIFIED_CONTAM: Retrovirus-related Pol polyprotein from transposon RE1 [Sesamum indicum]
MITSKFLDAFCFITNTFPFKEKFEPRALKCVFLGYVHGTKGYKVMEMNTGKIHISRDIIFHETTFPFSKFKEYDSDIVCPLPAISELIEDQDSNEPSHTPTDLNQEPKTITETHRRSTRLTRKPAWMNDYECYNIDEFINFHMTHEHACFVEYLSNMQEPRDFKQAQEKIEWRKAMQEEIDALEKSRTWKVTDLPPNRRTIGCKWLYKVKLNPDGSIDIYKARLVAKGYSQVEGEDYSDCFAPVAKSVTVRIFLAVAVGKGWPMHHLDVNNAFLHGTIDEDIYIYMDTPQGYNIPQGKVCELEKSLYGLKQTSRKWNEEFTNKVREFGFEQCSHDHCLFVKGSGNNLIALIVYVDDILITSSSESHIIIVKDYLDKIFTVKHLGNAKYFLNWPDQQKHWWSLNINMLKILSRTLASAMASMSQSHCLQASSLIQKQGQPSLIHLDTEGSLGGYYIWVLHGLIYATLCNN